MDLKILEYLERKSLHRVHYVGVVFWILISIVFFGILVDMEKSEFRHDFHCDGAKSDKADPVRGKCYEKYTKQHNKSGFPIYGFVLTNLFIVALVCAVYSQIVGPKIDQLSQGNHNDDLERQLLNQETAPSTGKKLFIAYCLQLCIRIVLGGIFIFLQTLLLYPLKFSSKFHCDLTDGTTQPRNSFESAQNSTLHYCNNQQAEKKTFLMYAVLTANGILFAGILIEAIYLFIRACIERSFMRDANFLKTHLSPNQHAHLNGGNETFPLKERHTEKPQEGTHERPIQHLDWEVTEQLQEQTFQEFIRLTKELIIQETKGLLELQSPFSGDPGDDTTTENMTLDGIYTNLVLNQKRERYGFPENREEQLQVLSRLPDEKSVLKSPKDFLNVEDKKVLVVGRPGIGKTFCCIKLLRDWASGKLFIATSGANINFDVAFLVKFRRFTSDDNLSLRKLLIQSEYFPTRHMGDKVWNHLQENPDGVLILFDGFDEFKHGGNIAEAPTSPENIEDKKPLQILYQRLVTGRLLKGASVLTTTRSTALSGLRNLEFDKTYDILGFSSKQIEEYVYKFAGCKEKVGETIWQHINDNTNLLTLCYLPVNSFIVCSSLSQILQFNNPAGAGVTFPSRLTEIYKIAVKVFHVKTTKALRDKPFTREDFESDHLDLAVEEEFEKLGRVAFEGFKKGEPNLGGNEVRGIEDSALLHRLPDRQTGDFKHEQQFCFIHPTMKEFFAARHIVNNMNKKQLRKFVSENIENRKWQLFFQFLAGFMEDKQHLPNKIITGLLPVKTEKKESAGYKEQWTENEKKRKVTSWPTKDEQYLAVTLIKCLNENSRMKSKAQRKLQRIKFNCVTFTDCQLTAVDCSSLVNVINVQQISHLDLSFNNIGPLGCLEICKLLKCRESQLSWLKLTKNQLTDEAAKYLAEAINNNNCQLRTLNLTANNISDIGAQHLAEAINNNNCQLRTLDLSANNISDIGAQRLAEAIKSNHCQLRTLDLSANKISDIGAKQLAKAINTNTCQLRTLDLSLNENITEEVKREALNLLGNCQSRCELIFQASAICI